MAVDYEAAWTALAAHVASKSQHGREATLIKMSELASHHRYPGSEIVLRVHGVETQSLDPHQVASAAFSGGPDSPEDLAGAAQHDRGDHDGTADEPHQHR